MISYTHPELVHDIRTGNQRSRPRLRILHRTRQPAVRQLRRRLCLGQVRVERDPLAPIPRARGIERCTPVHALFYRGRVVSFDGGFTGDVVHAVAVQGIFRGAGWGGIVAVVNRWAV